MNLLTNFIFYLQGNTSSSTLSRKLRSADKDSANLPDGIESLEGFVIVIYLVVAHSKSVGRQLLATFRSGRLRFVVFANDADLAYCHWLVPTSRTHEAIEGYIWEHKLLILGFGFSFRTLFSRPRVLSRDVRSR